MNETLGAHLRNLLSPYKSLLELVKNGKADAETLKKYNLDNLNDLIEFQIQRLWKIIFGRNEIYI